MILIDMNKLPAIRKSAAAVLARGRIDNPVAFRRELTQLPEVAAALGPVDKYVFIASTKTLIGEMDEAELVKHAGRIFRSIAMDVGFIIPPDNDDWAYIQSRLLQLLQLYYVDLSLADVKIAFELASVGQLDNYLPRDSKGRVDKNHYQQFNADYIGKILNAYKQYRSEVINKAYNAVESPEERPLLTAGQQRQYAREAEEMTVQVYQRYCNENMMPDDNMADITIMTAYGVLRRWGMAVEVETNEEDLQRALAEMIGRSASGIVNPYTAEHIKVDGVKHPDVINRSVFCNRRRALQASFDKMIADKISINELTKKIK